MTADDLLHFQTVRDAVAFCVAAVCAVAAYAAYRFTRKDSE